jgi:ring-1,2-phenylacetyl-CoA epoxidase subunit PaaC
MSVSKDSIKQYAIRLGDDAVVLGHRLSEWCRFGPFLEEDLALTNVALDFIGRARMFYSYAAELADDGSTEDTYPYTRDNREFGNLLLHELDNGDFAFSMVRQYFVDVYSLAYMEALQDSSDETLAAIASKAVKESRYHLRRSYDWMLRLGDGTQESNERMQRAVENLWGYVGECSATCNSCSGPIPACSGRSQACPSHRSFPLSRWRSWSVVSAVPILRCPNCGTCWTR